MPNNTYTVLKPFHLSARVQAKVGDTVKLEPRQARDELSRGRVAPKGKAAAAVAETVADAPKAKKV